MEEKGQTKVLLSDLKVCAEFADQLVIQQLRGPDLPNFDPLPP